METLKITCGSPELIRRLQKDVHQLLKAYEASAKDAGQKRSAMVAATKTRIVMGEK
jgi:F0F1-type ATP synthase membrane subunit b/b'